MNFAHPAPGRIWGARSPYAQWMESRRRLWDTQRLASCYVVRDPSRGPLILPPQGFSLLRPLGRVSYELDPLTLQAPKRWNLLASSVDAAGNLPNSGLPPGCCQNRPRARGPACNYVRTRPMSDGMRLKSHFQKSVLQLYCQFASPSPSSISIFHLRPPLVEIPSTIVLPTEILVLSPSA